MNVPAPTDPAASARPVPGWRRALPIAVSLVILALALHALAQQFSDHGYRQIRFAFRALDDDQIFLSILLGLGSYVCLVGFDLIGLRRSGHPVHPVRVALTAFLAHTLGQTVGFAAVTGGAVRLRGYGKVGLSLAEIGQVVLMSTLGFIFGAWVLLGIALLLEPETAARALPLEAGGLMAVGGLLLAAFAAMLAWVGGKGREFRFGKHAFWLPDARTVLLVTGISVIELGLAGGALYVLLPGVPGVGYFGFVGLYLIAVVAGLMSTVPAGLGVFEWSLLKLLPGIAPATVLAATLVYRVTYYVLPLVLASLLALTTLLRKPVEAGTDVAKMVWHGLRPWLPQLIALTVFAVGAALVIDGTLPVPARRQGPWVFLMETSHLLSSLGGVALLLIGQGLQRRSHVAWVLAMGISAIVPLLSWLRGGHPIVPLSALGLAVLLWASRREFYREGSLLDEAWSWTWIRNIGLVLVGTIWLLFFVYSHVEYQNELWWEFALSANAPRALRASLLVCVAVVGYGLLRLQRGTRSALPAATPAQLAALAPVLEAAEDTQACLVLTGDKALLRDEAGQGFVMMQRHGGTLIAMGDPVGPPDVARALIWKFREEADRLGLRPAFYQVGDKYWQTYLDMGLTLVKLGEEAIVPLADFTLDGKPRAELRQAWNKGPRVGLSFRVLAPGECAPLLDEMEAVSDEWLEAKSGEEKGFSLGSFERSYLLRFPIALAEHEGRIVAFANLWTAPAGKELSVDLMRHRNDAPKGTMDYLFTGLFLWGQSQGYSRFSLGMAPLSGLAQHRLAGRWNRFANLVVRHGERFYGFSGLRKFKAKFLPAWRTRYFAAPGGMHLPTALIDVTRLISVDPRRHE